MMRNYRRLGWAVMLGGAMLFLALSSWGVSAEELSPPYVIVLRPWSFDARAAATLPGRGLAYVVAQKGVAVFQGLELTGTIDIGSAKRVAGDTQRGYVYVTRNGNDVTVLSGTQKLKDITVGGKTDAIAVITGTGHVYVARPEDHKVTILQVGGENEIIKTIKVGSQPFDIAINPQTNYVYITNYGSQSVTIFDDASLSLVNSSVSVGISPTHVAVNSISGYVYVSNSGADTVSILKGTTLQATVAISEPGEIAVNDKNGHVFILSNNTRDPQNPSGSVAVFSGTTLLKTVDMPHDARAIDVNPNSGYVYVGSGSSDTSAVTVLSDTLLLETFPMGQTVFDIAVDPVSDLAYVPIYNGHVAVFGRTAVYATDPLSSTSSTTKLYCLNTQVGQNLPITLTIPAGGVSITSGIRILCTPLMNVDGAPDYIWARQGFRIFAADQDNVNLSDFTFAKDITTSFSYLSVLPASVVEDEMEFRRRIWEGVSNVWAWPTDGITFRGQNQDYNVYTVTLRQLGEYALVWFKPHVYLPLVMRSS